MARSATDDMPWPPPSRVLWKALAGRKPSRSGSKPLMTRTPGQELVTSSVKEPWNWPTATSMALRPETFMQALRAFSITLPIMTVRSWSFTFSAEQLAATVYSTPSSLARSA